MASRAQCRFGKFAVGLQMAIKFNSVKLMPLHSEEQRALVQHPASFRNVATQEQARVTERTTDH